MTKNNQKHPAAQLVLELLHQYGWNQKKLSDALDTTQATISRRLNGPMKRGVRREFANAFNLSIDDFDDMWRSKTVPQLMGDPTGGIPILGQIPAGNGEGEQWAYDSGVGEGYLTRDDCPEVSDDPAAFAVKVQGNSMSPVLNDGNTVICSPAIYNEKGFENGSIYAIRFTSDLDNEATLKLVENVNTDQIKLIPANLSPEYKAVLINREHIARAAKAVRVSHPLP